MKIKLFVFLIMLSCTLLAQTKVGQISFLLGAVEYSVEGVAEWKPLDVGMNVLSNWVIRGTKDAEIEITWDNGIISEISELNSVKVIDLMKKANLETDWLDKMKNKIDVMFTQNEASKVQGVAGIRRTEVTIEKEDSIYWAEPIVSNFNDGYSAFQNGDYDKAITIFEQVVLQEPLTKKGEIARSSLIAIYSQKNNKEKADEHLKIFLRDFPNSDLLNVLNENK
ncbi:MAG: tetratricopeptide repeat protein [Bacteroidetes bacterium]|nr:tetratricopeptide repeat protein [Bacteroidota bacterium]MBU1115744.1 tetratricopeptide repeat protein [Bacteroidota bacterium]MBU1799887.1 tetratricopeptide repeat protein [Bacteroidota bacterium]